ncbi:MAG: cardiolipin synthase [Paludibacteraceae bacterium]
MGDVNLFQLILSILYGLTIVSAILIVIHENRNPTKALTWILVLVFLPAIGLIFFYVFGWDYRIRKNTLYARKIRSENEHFEKWVENNQARIPADYQTLSNLLGNTSFAWVLYGSEVEIIDRGKRKFEVLLDDLENANHHIHIMYFLFNNDVIGQQVKEVLMRKASEGIEVRFLYENIANITVKPKFYYEMRKAGVEVIPFLNTRHIRLSKVNYRNHRKIVVIDGNIGYIGGMNIGDEYANDEYWRDTHLRITGSGAYGLQAIFMVDWLSSKGKDVKDKAVYFPTAEIKTDNMLQMIAGGPSTPWPNILQATVHSIVIAKDYIYLQTPYFLPTESLLQALQSAALSGVDVRLMVSKRSDSPYIDPAARSYYEVLLNSGMRIYEHRTKFIHAKTMVSDNYLSVIGSANMDFRSFEASFEVNCYLYDEKLALRNKEIFLEDMEGCNEIIYDEWIKRPFWKRPIESFMRLFAPLM